MPKQGDSESKDLVPIGMFFFNVLATLLGLVGQNIAGAGLSVAAQWVQFVNDYRARKKEAQLKRLQQFATHLEKRLQNVEKQPDDVKTDLFVEVVKKALDDDEAQKDPFYAAVIEWIIRDSPNRAKVRILSDAVKSLSYLELFCCIHEYHGRNPRKVLERDGINETLYIKRLAAVGLSTDGIRVIGTATDLGEVLKKYVDLKDLEPPNDVAKNVQGWGY